MRKQGTDVRSETDAARAGSTPHVVRWVLGIGLLAVIAAFTVIVLIGSASQGDIEEEANASQIIRDTEAANNDRSDIDGVVSQDADEFAPDTPADMIEGTEANPERTVQN